MTAIQEAIFIQVLRHAGIPDPLREYAFAGAVGRKFKFDFAWLHGSWTTGVAVEVEGGIYNRKAHGSITGILRDMEKYTLAAELGWLVLRYTPQELCREATVAQIKRTLEMVGGM